MIKLIILCSAFLFFGFRTAIFIIGAYRARKAIKNISQNNIYPFVSIIIPSRNEEHNVSKCIESIFNNNYPKENFEIIAVDDRSTDNTGTILDKLLQKYPNLKILKITEATKNPNLKGKPGALQAGINSAKGELILMTDADCIVNQNWIITLVSSYQDPEVGLSASFTNIISNRIFDRIQAVEWVYMHTMASAGIGLNQPLGCYGNNLSIRKKVFDDLGGYERIKFSVTEDLALLQAVDKIGLKIRYICLPESTVNTLPCKTLSDYIRQKHRWALGGLELGWRAIIFVVSAVAIWSGVIVSVISNDYLMLISILSVRLLGDFALIFPSLYVLKLKKLGLWIFPSVLVFMIMEILIPILVLNRETKWKGQVFKN